MECMQRLSFMTLFSATLISKDRNSAFFSRLYTTPLTAVDFILGYTLPILPVSVIQAVVCYIAAIILGLKVSINIIYAILLIIPVSLLYIALGLLFGSFLSDKQGGGICGALLTNLTLGFREFGSTLTVWAAPLRRFHIYFPSFTR